MPACNKLCRLAILSICLIGSLSACSFWQKDTSFEWLDIQAVPRANTERVFKLGDTWGDLAAAYVDLKQQCRATNRGVDNLQTAQSQIKKSK